MKEKIKKNKNENSLNSIELDEKEMSTSKKEKNIIDKYHNYIYNINSERNEKLTISRNYNNKDLLKYKINKNDLAIENIENINDYYNMNNKVNKNNDYNVNEENIEITSKILKII